MRRVIDPEPLPTLKGRFSQAMAAGPLIFLAGQIASDFETGLHPSIQANAGLPSRLVPIKAQTQFVLERQQRVARAADSDLARAAQVWSLHTDVGEVGLTRNLRQRFFDPKAPPAASTFGVERLTVAGGRIEIDAILAAPDAEREAIPFDQPQAAAFGASAAVRVGPFVFISSLSAIDFTSGAMPDAEAAGAFPFFFSSVKRQTAVILKRLAGILAKAGTSLDNVVKTQIFLPNLGHFAEFEEIWRQAFAKNPPARTVIPAKLTMPQCLVEMNAIAVVPDGKTRKEIVHTERAPTPSIHEPQAIKAGPFIFLSQLMATDYRTGIPAVARVDPRFPNHDSEVQRQLAYIFANADAILEAGGSSLKHIVRRHGFYSSFANNLGPARDLTLSTFLPDPSPSTTVALGTDLLVPGCLYLFDGIAVVK